MNSILILFPLFLSLSASAGVRTTHWMEFYGVRDDTQTLGALTARDGMASNQSTPLAPGQCFVTVQVVTNGDSSMTFVGTSVGRPVWAHTSETSWQGFEGYLSRVKVEVDATTSAPLNMTYTIDSKDSMGLPGEIAIRRVCRDLVLHFENWHR